MKQSRFSLLLPLLIAACHAPAEPEPEPKVRVRCQKPTREPLDETLELRGHLEPPPGGDLPLSSQVTGRIVDVRVREGQRVQAGDLVASVDDLASRDAVRQAEAAVATSRAAEQNANASLDRSRALVARGIAASQELDDASARAETEKQSVASNLSALDIARHTLGRVQVRAAFGGVVTRVWRGPGALVDGTAGTPIAQVAASGVEFVADGTERELAQVTAGRSARVLLGAGPTPLPGVVLRVSSALDTTTGLGQVRISLDSPGSLLIGAQGRATITVRHRDSVLLVANEALRGAVADGAEVVVCAAGSAQVRAIQVGYRDEHHFEAVSGLTTDDAVAIDHVLGLETGTALAEVP
jgi:RND family efflux transporter MFP subunit